MNEHLLHLAWKHVLYDPGQLTTTTGNAVVVAHPGIHNTAQGPDFLDARIHIGNSLWLGSVEMHLSTQDWYRHGHELDPNYNSVVLHVVGRSTGEGVFRADGILIPELELTPYLHPDFRQKATRLMAPGQALPCSALLRASAGTAAPWMKSWALESLQHRCDRISGLLTELDGDWHQLLWQETGAYLATPKNREAFRVLARQLTFKLIRPLLPQPADALEMVQKVMAGAPTTLPRARDLKTVHVPFHHFRMRPGSFPERRVAEWVHWFSGMDAWEAWMLHPSWNTFIRVKGPLTGIAMKQVLFMNVWLPAALVYQQWTGQQPDPETWIRELERLPPEKDSVIRRFQEAGFPVRHAADTMALHHLWKSMCSQWNCVTCALGSSLLTRHGNISRTPHRNRP